MSTYYYVCDACGNIVTIADQAIPEGESWECDECGGTALWEFTGEAGKHHALNHSAHIRDALRTGLFRRV